MPINVNESNEEKKSEIKYEIGVTNSEIRQIKSRIEALKKEKKQYETLERAIDGAIILLENTMKVEQDALRSAKTNRGHRVLMIAGEIEGVIEEIGENQSILRSIISSIPAKIVNLNKRINIEERALSSAQYKLDRLWNNYAILN